MAVSSLSLLLTGLLLAGCGRSVLGLDGLGSNESGAGGAGADSSEPASGGVGAGGESAATPSCADLSCSVNERCDPRAVACECLPGFARQSLRQPCAPPVRCHLDADCDDGDPCNGEETCGHDEQCEGGSPFECAAPAQCVANGREPSCACVDGYLADGNGSCLPACEVPQAPVFSIIDAAETLHFRVSGNYDIETAIQAAGAPVSEAAYSELSDVALAAHRGLARVLARVVDPSCVTATVFDAVYDVRETCAPASGSEGTTAVANDDARIVGWASAVESYETGPGVTAQAFMDPSTAVGPPKRSQPNVVSLGDGGELTLSFDEPIANGPAWDFAVFENAFNDVYLELGFVEVSSDGTNFLRFDAAFLGQGPSSAGYSNDARNICGLAGSYSAAFGTPFDLEALQNQPLARSGAVDLNAIRYVRIVDIVGDGNTLDSFGRAIFDPSPTASTAGFDASGVGVLHLN